MSKRANGYWDEDRCKLDALKFENRNKWSRNSPSAYNAARKNGWLEECCKHMPTPKPNGYISEWNKEKCKNDAIKYESIREWRLKSKSAYNFAKQNNFIDEIDFIDN